MSPILGSAIVGGLSTLGSALFGREGQKSANQTNIQLAREARDFDLKMWNAQNEYNTPQMQMQRLKEAGLNPNLVYGSGAGQVTAASPKSSPVPSVENELAALAQSTLVPVLSLYQDWQVKKAQIDNLSAQAEATRQNAALTALRKISQDYTNQKLAIERPWWAMNAENKAHLLRAQQSKAQAESVIGGLKERYYQEAYPALLQQILQRNVLLSAQTSGQQMENELSSKLKPYGLTSRDNVWARIILSLPSIFGKDFSKLFK